MSQSQSPHPKVELLADLKAGETPEGVDAPLALSHLEGCAECQAAVAKLDGAFTLLRSAPVPAPSELEWARMAKRAREGAPAAARSSRVASIVRAPFSWRMMAAAAVVAVMIPATLAWLLPPCRGEALSGDMLAMDDPGL